MDTQIVLLSMSIAQKVADQVSDLIEEKDNTRKIRNIESVVEVWIKVFSQTFIGIINSVSIYQDKYITLPQKDIPS